MKISLFLTNDPISRDLNEDDSRLLYSLCFVFLVFSMFAAHLFTKNMLWEVFSKSKEVLEAKEKARSNETVYEVLIEQNLKDYQKTEQIKALSDEDSSGSGGLTAKEGFHTSSPFREFILGSLSLVPQASVEEQEEVLNEVALDGSEARAKPKKAVKAPKKKPQEKTVAATGPMTKIPFNYRFEQDFLFRWNGSNITKIPTKKLVGFTYFKNMLRMIEQNFAPPGGGNYGYRDMAGKVISEGIIPGEIKVQFLLDESGRVLDVRKVTSHGQVVVDRACEDSIRGLNFGPVPEEIKAQGLIFGINFIFPGVIRY
jgi:outer membrane biosynthesis protein TonB